jgi:hypothetical protein
MTDRYKEMAILADKFAHYVCEHDANADWYTVRDRKFTEMIVLACANVVNDKRFDNTRPTMNIARAMILEQFNVEQ